MQYISFETLKIHYTDTQLISVKANYYLNKYMLTTWQDTNQAWINTSYLLQRIRLELS